ncbi:MAG: tail fiber domain-containing protein [Flavobacteriales bacterium]|nr:tail fiber domain-containing protein [Flavobacteriales bacterium]
MRAQVSTPFNNGGAGDFVGWDATMTTDPLEIKHEANQPIFMHTDNVWRLWMNETATYGMLGGYNNVPAPGFTLLGENVSNFRTNGGPGAFTLLHLAGDDDNAQAASYRDWMRTGITLTGNADHQYIGQKGRTLDETDLIIHWSDNPGEFLKDRMRFLFTSGHNSSATSGAESQEGLEFMRMFPLRVDEPHIGVGDFFAANLVDANITEPTERMDMVNGRLRIRDLPESTGEATGAYKVMVVDDTAYPSDERGVVKWATLPTPPAGDDCDWELDEATNRLWTATAAIGTNDDCPEKDWLVGIGTSSMAYKLDIEHDGSSDPISGGLRVKYTTGQSGWTYGVKSELVPSSGGSMQYAAGVQGSVSKATQEGWGVRGTAEADASTTTVVGGVEGHALTTAGTVTSAFGQKGKVSLGSGATTTEAIGLYGLIEGGGTATTTYGVYGYGVQGTTSTYGAYLWGNGPSNANVYGVYGRATGGANGVKYSVYGESAGGGANDWAIYSAGRTFTPGGLWTASDQSLKEEVGVLDSNTASTLLDDIGLHQFQFIAAACPQLDFPEGVQLGVYAQELEQILPQLVTQVVQPAALDSSGIEVHPPVTFKAVNYEGLIPYLIAGHQAQSEAITSLQTTVTQLQQQLAACCANPDGIDQRSGSAVDDEKLTPAQERTLPAEGTVLRIAPNPFTDRTTLFCTLERAGRMQLLANSADGRSLLVLSEGQREAGEFQFEWSTENLAPGVYYITLLLDGEPVVKRVVKVGR